MFDRPSVSTDHAGFDSGERRRITLVFWARAAGVASAVRSVGPWFRASRHNSLAAVAMLPIHAALALSLSGLSVLSSLAFASFLPSARSFAVIRSRFGFKSLWVLRSAEAAGAPGEALADRIRGSTGISILDVTGDGFLGKGGGPGGGILATRCRVECRSPVQAPSSSRRGTCMTPRRAGQQSTRPCSREMDVTHATFVRRVRATLAAVESLKRRP